MSAGISLAVEHGRLRLVVRRRRRRRPPRRHGPARPARPRRGARRRAARRLPTGPRHDGHRRDPARRPRMRALAALLALAALVLAGCGAGPRVTQTRHVAPFRSIEVASSIDVEVVSGDADTVLVSAGEHVIDHVETTARDGSGGVEATGAVGKLTDTIRGPATPTSATWRPAPGPCRSRGRAARRSTSRNGSTC